MFNFEQVIIDILKPSSCEIQLGEDDVPLYHQAFTLTGLETNEFELTITQNDCLDKITHWTNYSIRVEVTKQYDNEIGVNTSNSTTYQTGNFLIYIFT